METVNIFAKCFGGLFIEVDVYDGEVEDARFASTGNRLPEKMMRKLDASMDDQWAIADEVRAGRW